MKTFFFSYVLLLLLNACTPVASGDKNSSLTDGAAMGRSAIVTTGSASLDRNKPSTISLQGSVDVFGQREGVSNDALQQQVLTIISHQVTSKGYPMLSANGDFQLHATLILAADQQTLLQKTGNIDPGLMGGDRAAGKGSLVMELRQGRALRWRGVVQIYILPEYDPAVANHRIEYAVAQLLSTWP